MTPSSPTASPSRRGVLLGGAGLSALALAGLQVPSAEALPVGLVGPMPMPMGPAPLTAPVWDLGFPLGSGAQALYEIELDQTALRAEALSALKKLRREMFALNPWFEGIRLREALLAKGIGTADQYANLVQWSTAFEKYAVLRNLECYARGGIVHERPDGSDIAGVRPGGMSLSGESLALGYSSMSVLLGTGGWGYKELDALNASRGHWSSSNGHLYMMLDPANRAYGMAEFHGYYSAVCSTSTSESQTGTGVVGTRTLRTAVTSTALAGFALEGPSSMVAGARDTIAAVDSRGGQLQGTFSSSAVKIASIDATGRVSALTPGSTKLSLSADGRTLELALTVTASGRGQRFSDVPSTAPFAADIEWVAAKGIANGWSDGTYRPLVPVTRDQMAAFIYRAKGSPAFTAPAKPSFRDVPRGRSFYREIEWLASRGITKGWSDGTFRPLNRITRGEMAAFVYRAAGSPAFSAPRRGSFRDVPRGTAFFKEIEWMRATGISTGWPDGTYRPLDSVKRDAMAAFIRRAYSYLR